MKISRIKIENFKSIKKANVELRNLNVLIGANGAGKSNFISFFEMLSEDAKGNLANYVAQRGGANKFLYFGRKISDKITGSLSFNEGRYSWVFRPTDDDNLLLWGTEDTSFNSAIKQTCNVHDNRFLREDASNLSAFLYKLKLKHKKEYDLIEKTIKLIAPFFHRFELAPLELNPETIRLEWKEKGSDTYFNANQLSDGTLRMICLITLLLQPNPPDTIIIDEPELGLHPFAISILADLIKKASKRSQLIISTQSVTFVNHFSLSDIIVVDREDNQSKFRRLDEKELEVWLESYSLGELWEKNLIGGRP